MYWVYYFYWQDRNVLQFFPSGVEKRMFLLQAKYRELVLLDQDVNF